MATNEDNKMAVDTQSQLAATDSSLVLYAGSDESGPVDDWELDLASGEWAVLEADPLGPAFDRLLVWADDALYLFDHALVSQPGGASGPSLVRVARLRDGEWETLPTGEVLGGGLPLVISNRIVFAGWAVVMAERSTDTAGVFQTARCSTSGWTYGSSCRTLQAAAVRTCSPRAQ